MDEPKLLSMNWDTLTSVVRDPNEKLTRYEFLMELLDGWQKQLDIAERRRYFPGNEEAITVLSNAIYCLTKSYRIEELTTHSKELHDSVIDGIGLSNARLLPAPDATGDHGR